MTTMNDLIRRAAGRAPEAEELIPPGDDATDEQIQAWLAARKAQPRPGPGSADGGARSAGPGMTVAQRMNKLIRQAAGWER